MILLDTNVLSEVTRTKPAPQVLAWINDLRATTVYVSSVTEAELLLGVALLPAGKRRNTLAAQVGTLLTTFFPQRCLPFDSRAAAHYTQIVSHRQRIGRPISTEDAQIAAITISRGYQLATRNISDFANIEALSIVNPWDFKKPL
ncbi:MAG: type II toxin-antitoxin system VapC family toxin [bacterium]|nr:type II toxin-antitoxin system VapC family toxin [Betaproteobacteria bacterium]